MPSMPDLTLDQAEAILRARGDYAWALSGKQRWTVMEIKEQLNAMDIDVSRDTVTRWVKKWPQTEDFGYLGLRASRADLILFLAGRQLNAQATEPDD
jgi:hypothetical protein